jgi:predicted ArsR family transcriptional regulator
MPTNTPTARQRAIAILRDHPDGMSKNELRQAVGGNSGAFRRLLQSMEDRGEISVTVEDRPNCGPTKVHRAAEQQAA